MSKQFRRCYCTFWNQCRMANKCHVLGLPVDQAVEAKPIPGPVIILPVQPSTPMETP